MGPLTGVFFLFFIYKPVTFIIFNFKNYPENIYIYISPAMRSNLSRKQYSMVKRYICKYKQAKYSSSEYNVTSRARRFFPVKFYFITSIILLRIFAWRSVIFFSFFFFWRETKYFRDKIYSREYIDVSRPSYRDPFPSFSSARTWSAWIKSRTCYESSRKRELKGVRGGGRGLTRCPEEGPECGHLV